MITNEELNALNAMTNERIITMAILVIFQTTLTMLEAQRKRKQQYTYLLTACQTMTTTPPFHQKRIGQVRIMTAKARTGPQLRGVI